MKLKKISNLKFKYKGKNDDLQIEGYASVFGVKDFHGDIIAKGAFAKSIKEKEVKFLWQHEEVSPIGKITSIKEDDYGLYIKAVLTSGTGVGREAIDLVKKNIVSGLSIGFKEIESFTNDEGARVIMSLDLWEVSLVTFPANQKSKLISPEINEDLISILNNAHKQISHLNKEVING